MSKTLWNTDHQPVVLDWQQPAIMPGEPHEFTDEQIAAGVAGSWGEEDPRSGLEAEKAFKTKRDKAAQTTKE
jgi:hypothetical protein